MDELGSLGDRLLAVGAVLRRERVATSKWWTSELHARRDVNDRNGHHQRWRRSTSVSRTGLSALVIQAACSYRDGESF